MEKNKTKNLYDAKQFFNELGLFCDVPAFTQSMDQAKDWLKSGFNVIEKDKGNNFYRFVDHHKFLHKSGCSFYTQYIPKKEEYLFLFGESNIPKTYVKTATRTLNNNYKIKVRSYANGWCWKDFEFKEVPEKVKNLVLTLKEFTNSSVDQVKIMWNPVRNKAYPLKFDYDKILTDSDFGKYDMEDLVKEVHKKIKHKKMHIDHAEQIIWANPAPIFNNNAPNWVVVDDVDIEENGLAP